MRSGILIALAAALSTSIYASAHADTGNIPDEIKGLWKGEFYLKENYLADITNYAIISIHIGDSRSYSLLEFGNEKCFYLIDGNEQKFTSSRLIAIDGASNCPKDLMFDVSIKDQGSGEITFPSGIPSKTEQLMHVIRKGQLKKRNNDMKLPDIVGIEPGMSRDTVLSILENDGYTKTDTIGPYNYNKDIEFTSKRFVLSLVDLKSIVSHPDVFIKTSEEEIDTRRGPDMYDIISITYSIQEPNEVITIHRNWKPETPIPQQSLIKATQEKYGIPSFSSSSQALWFYAYDGSILNGKDGENFVDACEPKDGYGFRNSTNAYYLELGAIETRFVGEKCSIFIDNRYKSEKSYLQGMNRGSEEATSDIVFFNSTVIDAEKIWNNNWNIFNTFVEMAYEDLVNNSDPSNSTDADTVTGPAPRL